MGAPMAGVSGGKLAAATCQAGALGFIAAGHLMELESLEQELAAFRQEAPTSPLCIGFIGYSTFGTDEGWERYERVLRKHKPAVVQFFAPAIHAQQSTGRSNVDVAHHHAALVLAQVGSVQDGLAAANASVNGLIAQGSEAGGHGLRREMGSAGSTLARDLIRKVTQDIPVLLAGGIVDGYGVASALALGCDGVVLGTRLWASEEALGHESLKRALVDAESTDSVQRTTVFDQIQNTSSSIPWPEPFDSLGALRNETTAKWDGRMNELSEELSTGSQSTLCTIYREAQQEGNGQIAAVLCGEGVGAIDSIKSAYDIVKKINEESVGIVRRMPKMLLDNCGENRT